jgi:hypothetical protein
MRSLRTLKVLLITAILLNLGLSPAFGQCGCSKDDAELIFSHEFEGGLKLIICGSRNAEYGGKAESYSNITVISCSDARILLSIKPEETDLGLNMFRFELRESGVIVEQLIRLPSERDWRWTTHPFFEKVVVAAKGRLEISDWRKVFVVPQKSKEEIAALLDAYEREFKQAGDPIEWPSKLMLCAMNGSRKAERLFLDFPNDHREIFGGAIAESYSERLDFYRLMQQKR